MKFLVFLLLALTPSNILGSENAGVNLPMRENKLIEPNQILTSATVHEGCGGVVPLSTLSPSAIIYKEGRLYDPYEFCVWTLVPREQTTNIRVSITQTMEDSWDGITFYFLNSTGITSKVLSGANDYFEFNAPLAFVAFSTSLGGQSNGFSIWITSLGENVPTSAAAYHVRKDEGKFSFPVKAPLRNRDKALAAVVLQRKTKGMVQTQLEVNLGNVTIDEKDSIQVYSFNNRWSDEPLVPMGRFTTDDTFLVHSFHPVLILLESESKNLTGKSFQVEWKPYMDSIE